MFVMIDARWRCFWWLRQWIKATDRLFILFSDWVRPCPAAIRHKGNTKQDNYTTFRSTNEPRLWFCYGFRTICWWYPINVKVDVFNYAFSVATVTLDTSLSAKNVLNKSNTYSGSLNLTFRPLTKKTKNRIKPKGYPFKFYQKTEICYFHNLGPTFY